MRIEDLKKNQRTFTRTISATVSDHTHFILSKIAETQGTDISKMLRLLVTEFIDDNEISIESMSASDESPKSLPQTEHSLPQGM